MAVDYGLFVGWKGIVPGREKVANEAFGEYVGYLTSLQKEHRIESFEPVLLSPHGGSIFGYFLIRGERAKLTDLTDSDAWLEWQARGNVMLDGLVVVEAYLGERLGAQMKRNEKAAGKL